MKRSLFGAFDPIIDESVHVALSLLAAIIGYRLGLSLYHALAVFLAGSFLIDIDHFFNTFICAKVLKIPGYKGGLRHGDKGYSPHVFHGIDVALLAFFLAAKVDFLFGIFLFVSLLLHLLWDFAVYPNRCSWLFLASRAFKGFKVGQRSFFVGKIFDLETLTW